jgi:hypothetical protein
MALAEAADDVGLDDRESLGDAVLQVLIDLAVVEPLEEQPAGVGEVEERLALLVHEVAPVDADLESQVLDRGRVSLVAFSPCPGR